MGLPSAGLLDANVLIDFEQGEILDSLCEFPFTLSIPDIVVAELKSVPLSKLDCAAIRITRSDFTQLQRFRAYSAQHPQLSAPDAACLLQALDLGAVLFTGDSRLREQAQSEGVRVHGTLWLLELVVEHQIMTAVRARQALRKMLGAGSRLPADDANRLLTSWRR